MKHTFIGHTNRVTSVAFSPDGKLLAAANWQGRVYLWDFSQKSPERWWAHAICVNAVAFSPDGKTLASASEDGTVKLWNVATRREMVTLTGLTNPIISVSFSPDGSELSAFCYPDAGWVWKTISPEIADAQGETKIR